MVTVYVSNLGTDEYTVDGSADNAQINSALTYANNNGTPASPVTVYLRGPFIYDIRDSLLAGSNTILTGDTTAVLRLHNSAGWALWKPIIGQMVGVTPQNFTLSNITIDGNYANQPEYTAGNWGDGYYPGMYLQGTLSNPVKNVSIHDCLIKGTLTDGVRISYGDNIDFYNNKTIECMHEGIYVLRSLNCDIYDNDFTIRTNSGARCYNSQNVSIYNNTFKPYALTSVAGNFGIQIEDNSANTDIIANNIQVYNNTLTNCWGGGIWCIDVRGTSTDKVVKIHDNTISGCGRITTTNYNAGITIQGFNGIQIYKNVLQNNYNAGILVANAPTGGSGYTYKFDDNIVSGTLDSLNASPSVGHGYGVVNRQPSSVSIIATDNVVSGNVNGDYYQVNNINDVPTTPVVRILPSIRINEVDEIVDYYIPGYVSYVNGYPVHIRGFDIDTDESIGTDKPPGFDGWVLADFGADGASINFRCHGIGKDDFRRALAAWKKKGRTHVEIGDSPGWKVSGVVRSHNSNLDPEDGDMFSEEDTRDYGINFYCDSPFEESVNKHIRARKLSYSGEQWSSDNAYTGNIVNNPSFEEWERNNTQTWAEETPYAVIDFRGIDYSPDLNLFVAVASSGTGNRIQKSTGNGTWTVPSGLPANANINWRGIAWGSSQGITTGEPDAYFVVSSDGYYPVSSDGYFVVSNDLSPPIEFRGGRFVIVGNTAGTDGAAYSEDGNSWTAGVTPAGNYEAVCYVRDDASQTYRYVACGAGIIIYSDDGGASWDSVSVTGSFVAICYSPSLKRLVAVASTGQIIYSDDFAETWEAVTAHSQTWEDVKRSENLNLFIAISSNGTPQILTSETGLSNSWTSKDSPVTGSTVTPGEGDISSTTFTTPTGYVYTSAAMAYSQEDTSLEYTVVLPALDSGNFYRLDQVFCKLRTLKTGKIAYLKVSIQAASINGGAEQQVVEWTNNTTTYVSKSINVAIESATAETVTLRYYMKTSDSNYRSVATLMGYKVTTAGSTGGTVSYSYNQWSALVEAPELDLLCAFSKSGTGNRVMNSLDADIWLLGESSSNSAWSSACFAPDILKFVAVSTDGHITSSDNYGVYRVPDGWTLVGSGTSRADYSQDGTLSFCISGDGTTEQPGMITQPLLVEGGVTYSLTSYVAKTGASGSAVVDVYAGGQVISSLEWTADGEFSQLQKYFKFDFAPADALIRAHGAGTPDASTKLYFDSVRVQKVSDLDIEELGSDILTSGTVETVPDVIVEAKGVLSGSVSGGETAGNPINYIDLTDVGATTSPSYVLQDFFNYTIAGKTGVKYRIDKVGIKACVAASGTTCESKIEVYFGSTLKGTYTFKSTSVLQTYTTHSASPNLITEAGQAVTFKYYLRSSKSTVKSYIKNPSNTITEIHNTPTVKVDAGISIFNIEDPLTVLKLCNKIFPGIKLSINADGTGSLRYAENFADMRYQSAVLSRTGDNYSETLKQVLLTGNLVWEFDSLYPITGIPYVNLYVVSGIPKFEISLDNVQWFACDSNTSESLTNTQITRELDNTQSLRLYGATKFYLRLSPASGNLTFKAINLFSYLITIDAEHLEILPTGAANTFQVMMTNNVPCTISMKYADKHWM